MTDAFSPRRRARSGFSLAELLIALTLTAVIGAAVTTLFVSQNRFFDAQHKLGSAREVSRAALNVVLAELRMVERDNGVVVATDSMIRVRVPFASGIICTGGAASITAVILPLPNAIYNDHLNALNGTYRGFMFRPLWQSANNGQYTYVASTPAQVTTGLSTTCTAAGVRPDSIPNSRVITITPGHASAQGRWPIMLYSDVIYRFGASSSVPGRVGLFRQGIGRTNDELVAPFAGTARFRFHYGAMNGVAQDAPPGSPSALHGLELVLDGVSERPGSDGGYATVPLRTSVFFHNRRD